MKKLLLLSLIVMSLPSFGLVWEADPSITPAERRQRRELNKRIKQRGLLGSARLKGSHQAASGPQLSGIDDRVTPRERIDETDGGIVQMEEDTHESDVDFDDED